MGLEIYYNTGDDAFRTVGYSATYSGQTFTTVDAFDLSKISVLIYRIGSPGTITFNLYAVDGSGLPTGSVLASGTTNADTLTTNTAGEWRDITLSSPYALSATTKYAIELYTASGDSVNKCRWRADASSPSYSGGNYVYDQGAGWQQTDAYDLMFETYSSDASYVDVESTIDLTIGISGTAEVTSFIDLEATIALSIGMTGTLTVSTSWNTTSAITIKRLIAMGNDSLYYEDI